MQRINILIIFVMLLISSTFVQSLRNSRLSLSRFSSRTFSSSSTIGEVGTTNFRIIFNNAGKQISPWHDIPLKDGDNFNFVNEIPKYTKAKMEVSTKEEFNPIAQDIKKGKLRDYHGPIFWNYGCLPQTWEDPNIIHPDLKVKGDNDPVDVVEIGSKVLESGGIYKVKVLGVLAMIDDGELDWKILAINHEDPMASQLNDVDDIDKTLPGTISGIREWFRWYKTPDDKPLNGFGFDEKALPKKVALEVIHETHEYWSNLRTCKTDKGKLWIH